MCSLEDNILIVSDQIKHSGDGREPHEINDSCFVIGFPFSCFLLQMYIFIARICKSLGLLQGSIHMILWYILTCKHLNINNKKGMFIKAVPHPRKPRWGLCSWITYLTVLEGSMEAALSSSESANWMRHQCQGGKRKGISQNKATQFQLMLCGLFVFPGLGIEPRTMCIPVKCSTTQPNP